MSDPDWAEKIVRDLWRRYDLHPNIELTNHTSLPTELIGALIKAHAQGAKEGIVAGIQEATDTFLSFDYDAAIHVLNGRIEELSK